MVRPSGEIAIPVAAAARVFPRGLESAAKIDGAVTLPGYTHITMFREGCCGAAFYSRFTVGVGAAEGDAFYKPVVVVESTTRRRGPRSRDSRGCRGVAT